MDFALRPSSDFWRDRRVLLTGNTGFKGSWLSAWLHMLGAKVIGLALPPTGSPNLCDILDVPLEAQILGDIRDAELVRRIVVDAQPEIVLHFAAQALVRQSYADAIETFGVNVMGTAHVLDAVRSLPSVRAALVITTDKVYENPERGEAFRESEPLGGHDPYSTSKACAELVSASYRKSFFNGAGAATIATARAGNVIGGGDWSTDRLVPDLVRAAIAGEPVRLRYPRSVRPWLHVLEPLAGYLTMAEAMVAAGDFGEYALNFAPDPAQSRTVADLVDEFTRANDGAPGWVQEPGAHPAEAGVLLLSPERANRALGWRTVLSFPETVSWTVEWYRCMTQGGDARKATYDQIAAYDQRLAGKAAGE